MPTHRLATCREERSPVRVQTWNATIRAGDDLKLALTVYDNDDGRPTAVAGSRSRLELWPDQRPAGTSPDYGLGWFTGATYGPGWPSISIDGFVTDVRAGGVNFLVPGSITAGLWFGRYTLLIQIDLADGVFSQIEGVLQVRERWARPGLGHVKREPTRDFSGDFDPGFNPLTDADGFYYGDPPA